MTNLAGVRSFGRKTVAGAERAGEPQWRQAVARSVQDPCDVSDFDKPQIGRDAFPPYNHRGAVVVASAWLAFYVIAAGVGPGTSPRAEGVNIASASKRSSIIRRARMKTIAAIAAHKLGNFLTKDVHRIFGSAHDDLAERLGSVARSIIECLARSDALYHNYEHTLQVTIVGRDILQGMMVHQHIEPSDYGHLIVACLFHDIGYVRGVLNGDTETEFIVDSNGKKITLPRGASDAALTPYHVDRSKLFAFNRLEKNPYIDAKRIAEAIEMTRFPIPPDPRAISESLEPKLVQAADLIGQLGDPLYSRKANALFYEFEETGMNRQLGYSSPADIIEKYPAFFWDSVSMHLDDGIKYLNMTASGRQWIANLHHHILCAERPQRLMGPQG